MQNQRDRTSDLYGRRGDKLTEELVKEHAVGHFRKMISVAAAKAQCHSLLVRLKGKGPGAVLKASRRRELWSRSSSGSGRRK